MLPPKEGYNLRSGAPNPKKRSERTGIAANGLTKERATELDLQLY